jgi:hypothetical protein
MAPDGGSLYTNDTHFKVALDTPTTLAMTCVNAQPNPDSISTFGAGEPLVSWRGTGTASSDNTPDYKIGAAQEAVDLPIRVKAMKKREVKVVVHYVTGQKKDPATHEVVASRPPSTKPTATEIVEKLYDVFGRQINTWFSSLEIVDDAIDWDIGLPADWGSPTYPIASTAFEQFDRVLELGGNTDSPLPPEGINGLICVEEERLLGLRDSAKNANIDVFVVGGCWIIQLNQGIGGTLVYDDDFSAGRTNAHRKVVFVAGETQLNDSPVPKDEMLETIAHEIGHVLIGSGHPDLPSGPGPAPLVGTDRVKRLMFSSLTGKKNAGMLSTNLLVKKEWDAAEAWLHTNIDPP